MSERPREPGRRRPDAARPDARTTDRPRRSTPAPASSANRKDIKGAGRAADAGRPQTRPPKADRATKDPPQPAAGPAVPDAKTIRARRDPLWKRAVDWLLEDPSDKSAQAPTEREKAIAAEEAKTVAERRRYVRGVFFLKRREPKPDDVVAAEARLEARTEHSARQARIEGLYGPGAVAVPQGRESGPVARFLDRLVGAKRVKDGDGTETYLPPAGSDWRWKVHQFVRSQSRAMSFARTATVIGVVLMVSWVTVFAATGFDLLDTFRATPEGEDIDEEMAGYKYPFFIVESGSMMHRDASYGRIGTVDPGDLLVIGKIHDRHDVQTFYGPGSREVAGARGDVLVYLPLPLPDSPVKPVPVVHRPMAYIERNVREVPDPGSVTGTKVSARYTVEEFGIYDARAVTIPELGLFNYAPENSGFITRGDNERTNTWADQAMGVTAFPVPVERVLGRMVMEVPFIGLAKIAIAGQDPSLLSPDEAWCGFLAGKAACDTWQVFIVGVVALVGGPLVWATARYSRRAYVRRVDRLVLAKRQEEEADRLGLLKKEHADRREATEGREGLLIHDANDILTGAVRVVPERPRPVTAVDPVRRHGVVTVWAERTAPVASPVQPLSSEANVAPPAAASPPAAHAAADASPPTDDTKATPSHASRLAVGLRSLRDRARATLGRFKGPRSD